VIVIENVRWCFDHEQEHEHDYDPALVLHPTAA
jgi:hypothetical protein